MLLRKNATGTTFRAFLAPWLGCLIFAFFDVAQSCLAACEPAQQTTKSWEQERERAYARQQFSKNFRDLQLLGQNLLKEHEAGRLTSEKLAKDVKSINKCAKALRSLTSLGGDVVPQKINKNINTPQDFGQSIRRLSKHIWDYAHNPIHQNSKVFNTDQAGRARVDLLAIIDLSKAIENKAKAYSATAVPAQ